MSNSDQDGVPELPCLVAGEGMGGELLDVHYPYNGELAGRVRMVDGEGLECALNRVFIFRRRLAWPSTKSRMILVGYNRPPESGSA